MIYPNRVWHPTDRKTADNKPMWASREATPEDKRERVRLAQEYLQRQNERRQ